MTEPELHPAVDTSIIKVDGPKMDKPLLENYLLRNEILKLQMRNRDLQRSVFLLRQEKHGGKNVKLLKDEITELTKRLQMSEIETTRQESLNRDLTSKVKGLSEQTKVNNKMMNTLQQQNKTLHKENDIISDKLRNIPSEAEVKELRTLRQTHVRDKQEMQNKIKKTEVAMLELGAQIQQLQLELARQKDEFTNALEKEENMTKQMVEKLIRQEHDRAHTEEEIDVLTTTKLQLLQMLHDAMVDAKDPNSTGFADKLEAMVNKLGWANNNK